MRKLKINLIYNNKNFLHFINSYNTKSSYNNNIVYSYIDEIDEKSYKSLFKKIKDINSWFYFNTPAEKKSFLAFGNLFKTGKEFISQHAINLDTRIPTFFGGAMFPLPQKTNLWNSFQKEEWFVPEFILIKNESKFYLASNFYSAPQKKIDSINFLSQRLNELTENKKSADESTNFIGSEVDYNTWTRQIASALEQINKGYIDKVVLARYLVKTFNKEVDLSQIILRLEERYPECYVYLWRRNKSIFFGASPEKFISIREKKLSIDALAGSAKRGKDEIEDEAIAIQLLNDSKNLYEHNAVLSYILDKINKFSFEIHYPEKPKIKKLQNIQHLWTPVTSVINKEVSTDELINSLFPTPAVCGLPRKRALELIEKSETFDRGLYAGVLGWKDLEGNAELTVSIRSGLIKNNQLYLYAGSGIVAGSDSMEEFNETKLKLKPILNLFYT